MLHPLNNLIQGNVFFTSDSVAVFLCMVNTLISPKDNFIRHYGSEICKLIMKCLLPLVT
jgi:hypothetical protein